ncbi:hypothetical protein AMTR_s00020p00167970 [Amborella trichopoda]|uniref:Uncharacterized protein n=1 Tax=Amborella trichopoda TaxID=13333 RepID=W1PPC9_AMBTC|nr:hypothetical protein AMTR_s00020p00167970 [Amborella trichopoda]
MHDLALVPLTPSKGISITLACLPRVGDSQPASETSSHTNGDVEEGLSTILDGESTANKASEQPESTANKASEQPEVVVDSDARVKSGSEP